MKDELFSGYQYDRCVSRGICSINPATAALQEIIILYLKQASYFALKMEEFHNYDTRISNLILNTISILSTNYEISEANFNIINNAFCEELPRIQKEFENLSTEKNLAYKKIKLHLKKNLSISEYIRLGEKEFHKNINNIPAEILTLFKILFILVKSTCINILTVESYGINKKNEILFIFKILNSLNAKKQNSETILKLIVEISELDCSIMEELTKLKEKYYGEQEECEVSFSTRKGKSVLVVGSNIRELEHILEEFKNTDIDIYTHDNMILAHTYPKFREYKNLQGQYGQGMESCLLDFSTFPGPIVLTRHSLFNVENLYRGRLFSTDFAYSKGVMQIKNNDYSELINSAKESKGFKTGKTFPSKKVGFSYKEIYAKLDVKLKNSRYSNIIIVGLQGSIYEKNDYCDNLFKHIPDNTFLISLSCCKNQDNLICLNSEYDICALLNIVKYVAENYKQNLHVFTPFFDRHTLSVLINLSVKFACNVFISTRNQTFINSNIFKSLMKNFNIYEMTTPKKDIQIFNK